MDDIEFDPESERRFVTAVLRGQAEDVERLSKRLGCVPRMIGARNQRMGSPLTQDELDEVVQDTFVTILQQLESYEPRAPLEAWIHGICMLKHLGAVRAKGRARAISAPLTEEIVPADTPSRTDAEIETRANTILSRLSGLEAQIVRLKHMDGLTFEQLAVRLEISPNTAKTVYYRGLRRLRTALELEQERSS